MGNVISTQWVSIVAKKRHSRGGYSQIERFGSFANLSKTDENTICSGLNKLGYEVEKNIV